jgi:hypothetical protein
MGLDPEIAGFCTLVAVIVMEPTLEGVKTPTDEIVPEDADHLTLELKPPVPPTKALQLLVWVSEIVAGAHATPTEVTVGPGLVTITVADPVLLVSCVDVARITLFPVVEGVNRPPAVIVPPVADHVTDVLKLPVPVTVAAHALV